MIAAVRDAARWRWNRARYVAQTEGMATLVRRTAGVLHLLPQTRTPERLLVRPATTPVAAGWPIAVLLMIGPDHSPDTGLRSVERLRQCSEADLPAIVVPAGTPWRPAAQLASVLLIQPDGWADELPDVLDEAKRLQQTVILDLAEDAGPDGGPALRDGVLDDQTRDGSSGVGGPGPLAGIDLVLSTAEGSGTDLGVDVHCVPLNAPGRALANAIAGGTV